MSLRLGMWRWLHGLGLGGALLLSLLLTGGHAQGKSTLTPDGTLGTTVTQRGTVFDITGGTRHGPNLFHSFDRFSVGTGETATFTSAQTGIKNILSRVTGGQRSEIDGQLRTDGQLRAEGADLYLLNPAGVLFGPNATLDVSGSFHVSTADYLRLADGPTRKGGGTHCSFSKNSRTSQRTTCPTSRARAHNRIYRPQCGGPGGSSQNHRTDRPENRRTRDAEIS